MALIFWGARSPAASPPSELPPSPRRRCSPALGSPPRLGARSSLRPPSVLPRSSLPPPVLPRSSPGRPARPAAPPAKNKPGGRRRPCLRARGEESRGGQSRAGGLQPLPGRAKSRLHRGGGVGLGGFACRVRKRSRLLLRRLAHLGCGG